jgi:hypothetical protein
LPNEVCSREFSAEEFDVLRVDAAAFVHAFEAKQKDRRYFRRVVQNLRVQIADAATDMRGPKESARTTKRKARRGVQAEG